MVTDRVKMKRRDRSIRPFHIRIRIRTPGASTRVLFSAAAVAWRTRAGGGVSLRTSGEGSKKLTTLCAIGGVGGGMGCGDVK